MTDFREGLIVGIVIGAVALPLWRIVTAMIEERREFRVPTWGGKERKEMLIREQRWS